MRISLKIILSLVLTFSLFSCEETIFETDISDQNVNLVAPSDDAQLDFTSVNFNWTTVQDADQYQLQIATPNFDNPVQVITDVTIDSLNTFDVTLSPNLYEWRVKAINSAYETQYTIASFEILNNDNFPGNVVTITGPDTNLVTNETDFILQWNAVQEATLYRIQIIDNLTTEVLEEVTSENTAINYSFSEGDLSWQVRAERNDEVTLYTTNQLLVDTTSPAISTLLSPENEITLSDTSVTFTWNRTPITGSTEIDSLYIYQDKSLSDLVEKQQVTSGYNTTLTDNNTYYWRMQAFDAAGNESSESSVFSFTIN